MPRDNTEIKDAVHLGDRFVDPKNGRTLEIREFIGEGSGAPVYTVADVDASEDSSVSFSTASSRSNINLRVTTARCVASTSIVVPVSSNTPSAPSNTTRPKDPSPALLAVKVFRHPSTLSPHEARKTINEFRMHFGAYMHRAVPVPTQNDASNSSACTDPDGLLSAESTTIVGVPPAERHPNILPVYTVLAPSAQVQGSSTSASTTLVQAPSPTPAHALLLMPFCEGGDLWTRTVVHHALWGADALIRRLFTQVASAVEHCHSLGIWHRDVKPENVFLTRRRLSDVTEAGGVGEGLEGKVCGGEGEWNAVLGDFGLATRKAHTEGYGVGSCGYRSPECIGTTNSTGMYINAFADIWSLGTLFAFMIAGRTPWDEAGREDACFMFYIQDPALPAVAAMNDASPDKDDPITQSRTTLPSRAHLLRELLPLSPRAAEILARVLDVFHVPHRTRIPALIEQVRATERFGVDLLDEEEMVGMSERVRWVVQGMSGGPRKLQGAGIYRSAAPSPDSSFAGTSSSSVYSDGTSEPPALPINIICISSASSGSLLSNASLGTSYTTESDSDAPYTPQTAPVRAIDAAIAEVPDIADDADIVVRMDAPVPMLVDAPTPELGDGSLPVCAGGGFELSGARSTLGARLFDMGIGKAEVPPGLDDRMEAMEV